MYGVKKEESFKFLTNKIKLSKETLNFIESQDKNKILKNQFGMLEIKIIREKCKAKVETNG